MKFAFISGYSSVFAWKRLIDEGHEVQVFNANRFAPNVGKGLVTLHPNISSLISWGGTSAIYIADLTKTKEHSIDIGATCDALRAGGKTVLCGGKFADKLEDDRAFGQRVAQQIGFALPPSHSFATLADTIAHLEKDEEGGTWYFKMDEFVDSSTTCSGKPERLLRYLKYLQQRFGNAFKNHIEQKVEGAAFMNAGWFNGEEIVHGLLSTVELKKAWDNELGPATGCSANIVYRYHAGHQRIRAHMEAFAKILRENKAPRGLYDCNCIMTPEKEYFLEWTPRWGYDSEATGFQLIPDLGQLFLEAATGVLQESHYVEDQAAYGIRLSVPPYPDEHYEHKGTEKSGAYGVPVIGLEEPFNEDFAPYGIGVNEDGFYVTEPLGTLGVAITTGTNIRSMNEQCVEFAQGLRASNPFLQLRTDGAKYLTAELKKLETVGVELPPWLVL
jgi:phosphoribosylamine---glycine ligase